MTFAIPPGHRCDWWRIVTDLQMHMSLEAIADVSGIPKATILGYKNVGAEPKHADGMRILALWQARMVPPVPVMEGTTRSRRAEG
jgi:predicted transcriptional regulator